MLLDNPDFYLMSQSPRRKLLLEQLGTKFNILSGEVDETPLSSENPLYYVARIAHAKASAGWDLLCRKNYPRHPVLAADTTVIYKGNILGKPKSKADALAMLAQLSNSVHTVSTAIAIVHGKTLHERISTTQVEFSTITPQTAENYWNTGEPKDKAGAYGIQGLGAAFVKNITGSYSGVVGLPLWETIQLFTQLNIPYWNPK